jgi:hypothetical protein
MRYDLLSFERPTSRTVGDLEVKEHAAGTLSWSKYWNVEGGQLGGSWPSNSHTSTAKPEHYWVQSIQSITRQGHKIASNSSSLSLNGRFIQPGHKILGIVMWGGPSGQSGARCPGRGAYRTLNKKQSSFWRFLGHTSLTMSQMSQSRNQKKLYLVDTNFRSTPGYVFIIIIFLNFERPVYSSVNEKTQIRQR